MTKAAPNTSKFIRKPVVVEAIQATGSNLESLRQWCGGTAGITGEGDIRPGRSFVQVPVKNTKTERHGRMYPGDWLVLWNGEFRVWTRRAFEAAFDQYNDAFDGLLENQKSDAENAVVENEVPKVLNLTLEEKPTPLSAFQRYQAGAIDYNIVSENPGEYAEIPITVPFEGIQVESEPDQPPAPSGE